jgi:flagellar protein FliT
MDALQEVYKITLEMKDLLEPPITSQTRESIIEELNRMIEERGRWMEQISPPYTEEEREFGERIYKLNIGIEEKMHQLFGELKIEMKQIQKQKKSQQTYSNPYKQVAVSDGTFLDKKK